MRIGPNVSTASALSGGSARPKKGERCRYPRTAGEAVGFLPASVTLMITSFHCIVMPSRIAPLTFTFEAQHTSLSPIWIWNGLPGNLAPSWVTSTTYVPFFFGWKPQKPAKFQYVVREAYELNKHTDTTKSAVWGAQQAHPTPEFKYFGLREINLAISRDEQTHIPILNATKNSRPTHMAIVTEAWAGNKGH